MSCHFNLAKLISTPYVNAGVFPILLFSLCKQLDNSLICVIIFYFIQ